MTCPCRKSQNLFALYKYMNKVYQKAELAANTLIIVVAVLLGGILIYKNFFAAQHEVSNQQMRLQPVIGTKMSAPDVDWAKQPKTLIMALQKGCRFCTESAHFYKRVIESAKSKNVKLVAALPTSIEESAAYLNNLGLQNIEVKQSSLGSLQVSGTPTLILTNDKGEVINYWVGKLPPDKETELLTQLQ